MLHDPSLLACRNTLIADPERNDRRARLGEALQRTGEEDREAFRLVYTLTSNKLFGVCVRICGDQSAAEDVLADVYLTIWKRAGAWDPARGSAIAWLCAIARNRAIDWHRAQAVRAVEITGVEHEVADGAPTAETFLLLAESSAQIRRCLHALRPEQESAIRAAFFGGFTYQQLAAHRGVPEGTMKAWVRRGLAQMRAQLEHAEQEIKPPSAKIYASPQPPQRFAIAPKECLS